MFEGIDTTVECGPDDALHWGGVRQEKYVSSQIHYGVPQFLRLEGGSCSQSALQFHKATVTFRYLDEVDLCQDCQGKQQQYAKRDAGAQ